MTTALRHWKNENKVVAYLHAKHSNLVEKFGPTTAFHYNVMTWARSTMLDYDGVLQQTNNGILYDPRIDAFVQLSEELPIGELDLAQYVPVELQDVVRALDVYDLFMPADTLDEHDTAELERLGVIGPVIPPPPTKPATERTSSH